MEAGGRGQPGWWGGGRAGVDPGGAPGRGRTGGRALQGCKSWRGAVLVQQMLAGRVEAGGVVTTRRDEGGWALAQRCGGWMGRWEEVDEAVVEQLTVSGDVLVEVECGIQAALVVVDARDESDPLSLPPLCSPLVAHRMPMLPLHSYLEICPVGPSHRIPPAPTTLPARSSVSSSPSRLLSAPWTARTPEPGPCPSRILRCVASHRLRVGHLPVPGIR